MTPRKSSGYRSTSHPAATATTVAAGTGWAALAPAMISASVTTSPAKLSVPRRYPRISGEKLAARPDGSHPGNATNALMTLATPARIAYSKGATSTCCSSAAEVETRGSVSCESRVVRPWPG